MEEASMVVPCPACVTLSSILVREHRREGRAPTRGGSGERLPWRSE